MAVETRSQSASNNIRKWLQLALIATIVGLLLYVLITKRSAGSAAEEPGFVSSEVAAARQIAANLEAMI